MDTIPERPSPSASMYLDKIDDEKTQTVSKKPRQINEGSIKQKRTAQKYLTRNMGKEQIDSTPSFEDCTNIEKKSDK